VLSSDGIYKLNDFNRARFITWDIKKNSPCKFKVGNNPGAFRAPEEYLYEPESEKIDIYSLGNVFYSLLTDRWPFQNEEDKDAQQMVMHGRRPHIPSRFPESNQTEYKALLKVIDMCWEHLPEKRATADEIASYLEGILKELGPLPDTTVEVRQL
jgi:serine/threonine protein kinase